jgi:hypothetical protein
MLPAIASQVMPNPAATDIHNECGPSLKSMFREIAFLRDLVVETQTNHEGHQRARGKTLATTENLPPYSGQIWLLDNNPRERSLYNSRSFFHCDDLITSRIS